MPKTYLDYEGLQSYTEKLRNEVEKKIPTHAVLSQEEFNALPEDKKNNGVYFIPGPPGVDAPRYAILTQEEFNALPLKDQTSGLYFVVKPGEATPIT